MSNDKAVQRKGNTNMTPVSTTQTKTTIETHPVQEYVGDERVNRILSGARVAKLRANLDLDAIGTFVVSKRDNGEMVVIDGGHRYTALMEEGFGEFEVTAVVHHDLDQAGE